MEDEILEPTPEAAAPDPTPAETNNNMEPENPVNTGLPETPQDQENDQKDENSEEISSNDDIIENDTSFTEGEDEEKTDDTEESGSSSGGRNVTIVRPMQQFFYQADEDATYHTIIDNAETDPVPVVVVETLIEKELGIMDKRLEDYTVTESLLLLILITLWLRVLFDYSGRRKL